MKLLEIHEITIKQGGKIREDIKPERVKYITEEVARWRKANHIHKWFVDNVQRGVDDCNEYNVSREQLKNLLDTCKTVLAASNLIEGKINNGYTLNENGEREPIVVDGKFIEDATVAQRLLPTSDGFFFGSTDYDEYYLEDVRYTVDTLKPLVKENSDGDFYYSSSW